jgi:hypothetical protein
LFHDPHFARHAEDLASQDAPELAPKIGGADRPLCAADKFAIAVAIVTLALIPGRAAVAYLASLL